MRDCRGSAELIMRIRAELHMTPTMDVLHGFGLICLNNGTLYTPRTHENIIYLDEGKFVDVK